MHDGYPVHIPNGLSSEAVIHRDVAALDLNLLVALEALLEERHVTRAARRLRTSQPAASRSLARLRVHFADPLLVKVGTSLQLTPRAQAILPRLVDVLRAARALTRAVPFTPKEATGVVRLAAPDTACMILVPPLLAALADEAPGLDLEVVQWQPDFRAQLERGDIDLTVGFPKGEPPQVYARTLFSQDWAVVLRRGHPALRKPWTPALFASLEHGFVSFTGRGGGQVDEALSRLGRSRRVKLRVPSPLLSPMLAARTDLVVTTVRWLALELAAGLGLVVRKPPLSLPRLHVPMVWHERAHNDPKQRWFRDLLARVASDLDPKRLCW
jgi:DNA-binding transcriptional LysR family regulator